MASLPTRTPLLSSASRVVSDSAPVGSRWVWPAALMLLATFIAHSPALRGGFVWDDDRHVTAPELRSLNGLELIWTDIGATQQYYPLLHSLFWLEHHWWGEAAFGYHLANLSLHALAAVLLGMLLRRLAIPGGWFAAALFALHPVQVESVAWISEQKNTLSTIFYLGAALVYLRFDRERHPTIYIAALALFVLGLLTKTVIATLPAALLVTFWWQRGRLNWRRDILPLVPWFVIGAACGLFTAWLERKLIGAEGVAYDLTLLQRSLLAPRVVWFYLGNLVWPANLTFIYPRWNLDPAHAANWLPLVALAPLSWLLLRYRNRRGLLATTLLFVGSLFPVLGFFNIYPFLYSFVADHFQYLASIAPLAAASACAMRFFQTMPRVGITVGAAVLVALGLMTWQQASVYRDVQTLYRTTIARNPACWMAHNNLGRELMADKSRLHEAIACFERALALRPAYPEAHTNLGLALTDLGRTRDAIPHLETAVRLKPNAHQIHNNLGIALARSGRAEDAVQAFARAASLNPTLPNIHENWAKALLLLGRRAEADEHFATAARLRTNSK